MRSLSKNPNSSRSMFSVRGRIFTFVPSAFERRNILVTRLSIRPRPVLASNRHFQLSTLTHSLRAAVNVRFRRISSVSILASQLLNERVAHRNGEAVMWRITTRGFTLEEVLIMATMNVAVRTHSDRGTQAKGVAGQKGDHDGTKTFEETSRNNNSGTWGADVRRRRK